MYALGLPHRWQRLWWRTANFCVLFHFWIFEVLANGFPYSGRAKGMPSKARSRDASASVQEVVVTVT